MVKKWDKSYKVTKETPQNVQADVIILGCSLPGIVTAHELKRQFGNSMDIVVLDLADAQKSKSKLNVAFKQDEYYKDNTDNQEEVCQETFTSDDLARLYLTKYAQELKIPLPDFILEGGRKHTTLNKLFQHTDGNTVECTDDFHDFTYLNFIEKFELNQYQAVLDHSMRNMFNNNKDDTERERKKLLYYDHTTMEQHICDALLFSTSRDIMRTTVRLVCGAPANRVSVLFYLHQCYRTNSARNHLDGDNTRCREKLIGYCKNRLASQLQQSVADIILASKPIKQICTYSDEQVILKTMKGETNYVCNLLAMALRPDELFKIEVEDQLLAEQDSVAVKSMMQGRAKKFAVQYEENFWQPQGYSGDILSIKGPIIWATEKPKLSNTGSLGRYSTLIGYLKVKEDGKSEDNKTAVMDQLVKLFGSRAAFPLKYKETEIDDVFVPRCGDYVAVRKLMGQIGHRYLEWGTLDIFADGDVAAALQAGHTAYLHLLASLRPQAQTFDDLCAAHLPTAFCKDPLEEYLCEMNYKRSIRLVVYTAVFYIGIRILRSYMQK